MNLETFNDDSNSSLLLIVSGNEMESSLNFPEKHDICRNWQAREGSMDTKNTHDRVEIYKTHSKKS